MTDMGYQHIAGCYDVFTADIDYGKWADYLESLFHHFHKSPKLVLDLCCGTGNLTAELSARGYDMIGVDLSEEMLNEASAKNQDGRILYLCQDMTEFELYGTVDAVICTLDAVNCLLERSQLLRCFQLVKLYLNPGGLFLFDIHTRYKFESVLRDNTFYYQSDRTDCVWENDYHPQSRICDFYLTFYEKRPSGLYAKSEDHIRERAYSERQIKSCLAEAGLEVLGEFDELSQEPPRPDSQRIFFAAGS